MSLSFAVLAQDGSPERELDIRPDVHRELIAVASRFGDSLFMRMSEYYEDADFRYDELDRLMQDAVRIATVTKDDALRTWIGEFIRFAEAAIKEQRDITLISD